MTQRTLTCPNCHAPIDVPDNYFKAAIACGNCSAAVSRLSGQLHVRSGAEAAPPSPQFARPSATSAPTAPSFPDAAHPPAWPHPGMQPPAYPYPPGSNPANGAAYPAPGYPSGVAARRGMGTALKVTLIVVSTVVAFGIIAGVLFLAAIGRGISDANVSKWEEYKSDEGCFAVRLPGEPVNQTKSITSSDQTLDVHLLVASWRGRELGAFYFDAFELPEEPNSFDFDAAVKSIATQLKGTIKSQGAVKVAGRDGYGAEFLLAEERLAKVHMLVADERVFGVQAANYRPNELAAVDSFLASFRLDGSLSVPRDPWLPYRSVGNTWATGYLEQTSDTHTARLETMVVKEVRESGASVEQTTVVRDTGEVRKTQFSVTFTKTTYSGTVARNSPKGLRRRIWVPAGEFTCTPIGTGVGQFLRTDWVDVHTGLVVKSTAQWNRGSEDLPISELVSLQLKK